MKTAQTGELSEAVPSAVLLLRLLPLNHLRSLWWKCTTKTVLKMPKSWLGQQLFLLSNGAKRTISCDFMRSAMVVLLVALILFNKIKDCTKAAQNGKSPKEKVPKAS